MRLLKVYENVEKCCGCGACAQACPKNAITMNLAMDGYTYPVIDETKCIGCLICQKKCQYIGNMIHPNILNDMDIYAAHGNAEEMNGSASGGVFYVAAKEILRQHGVVFGCKYDSNMTVIHTSAETIEEIQSMRNSKYVQSNIGNTYKQAEKYLQEDRVVLYSGTPCQIAGLYNFIGHDYQNLLTMDLVCYGVTPPKMFAEYIDELTIKVGSKPIFIDFRDKTEGWGNKYVRIEFKDKSKSILMKSIENEYKKLFDSKYAVRASCNNCVYARMRRFSDITLADYWGIEQTSAKIDYHDGVSKVFVNTEKGRIFYKSLSEKLKSESMSYETAVRPNLCGKKQENEKWTDFRYDYETYGYKYVMEKYFQ